MSISVLDVVQIKNCIPEFITKIYSILEVLYEPLRETNSRTLSAGVRTTVRFSSKTRRSCRRPCCLLSSATTRSSLS